VLREHGIALLEATGDHIAGVKGDKAMLFAMKERRAKASSDA
jgi:hypothetical protein